MDIHQANMLQKLRSSYQVAMLMLPLLDACQRHKESVLSQDVELEPSSLLREVFSASNKVYQHIASKEGVVCDTNFVMSSLNVLFSKALRNNIVLYGSTSLDMIVDDSTRMFDSHLETMHKWAGHLEKISVSSVKSANMSTVDKQRIAHDVIGYQSSTLLTAVAPFHLFHANLLLVGRIDVVKMQALNSVCSDYVIAMIDSMISVLESAQGSVAGYFSTQSMLVCSEVCAMHCYELHSRLLKSSQDVSKYIEDPAVYLEKIVPAVMSSFAIMNDETSKMMTQLMNGG